MFELSSHYLYWFTNNETFLVADDNSSYIYFGSSDTPDHQDIQEYFQGIQAISAYDPSLGLSSDGTNLDITQLVSDGYSLTVPLERITDVILEGYLPVFDGGTEKALPIELDNGNLHVHSMPNMPNVAYLGAHTQQNIVDKLSSSPDTKIYVTGVPHGALRDAADALSGKLEGYNAGQVSEAELVGMLSVGGEQRSALEVFAAERIKYDLNDAWYENDQSAKHYHYNGDIPLQGDFYALIEVPASESGGALYHAVDGTWLRPVFAGNVQDFSAALLDPTTGALVSGLREIGVYANNNYSPSQWDLPLGQELTDEQSIQVFNNFWDPKELVDFFASDDINYLLSHFNGFYRLSDLDLGVTPNLLDFIYLDIYNSKELYLDLTSVSHTQAQSFLDELQMSNNNDVTLSVLLNSEHNSSLDFSVLSETVNNVNLLPKNMGVYQIDISDFVFAPSQALTLSADLTVQNFEFQNYGFYYDASFRSVDGGLPDKLIIEDGAFLRVDADTAVHDLPVIVNDGMGVLDLVGGDSDETIYGTNGMDILSGAGGNDILYGGTGPDTFIFYHDDQGNTSGDDVIMDFNLLEGDRVAYQFWDTGKMSWQQGQPVETIEETYGNAGAYFVDGNGDYFFEGGSVELRQNGLPSSIYEIYEVPGDRWANMITFGVRVKDEFRDMDFDNFNFGLSWDTTEFSYVPGTFEAGLATTQSMEFAETVMQDAMASYGHLSAAFVADSTYRMNDNGTPEDDTDDFKELDNPFNYDVPQYEIGGKKYDPYIAKFMLERIDESSGENSFTHFSSYAYLEENVELGGFNEISVAPNADAIAKFDYGPDNLKVTVANPIGTYAPNPELFVSDGTIADGLSIVPVDKMGDIVVFQVIMNVSYPTTLLDTLDHANSASIEITADEIFTDSVYQRVDDAGTVGAVTTLMRADGAATGTAITTEDKAAVDFWDEVDAIADGDGDFTALNTASTITLDFSNIGDGGQIAQDGKYVLAEFVARNSDAGFDYSYYNNDVDATTAASSISMYSQAILDGTLTRQIDDGSDVTVLGDTYYQNPFSFAARINSNDASTALKISVADPGGSRYGEADFMSADYNGDGEVTSGDAYDILRTAAFMEPEDPDAGPFWSYVRDVDTASSLVNLGVAVPAEFDAEGNVTNVPDLTPTISYDRTLDLFIGTDTVINATAVLTGDTDHNYMMLTSAQDPVLKHYDGFIGTWRAPAVVETETPTTPVTPDATVTLSFDQIDMVSGLVGADNLVKPNGDGNVYSSDTVVLGAVSASQSLTWLDPTVNVLVLAGDDLEAPDAMGLEDAITNAGVSLSFSQAAPFENDPDVGDGFIVLYDTGVNTRSAIVKFNAMPPADADIFTGGYADIIDFGEIINGVEVDYLTSSQVAFSSGSDSVPFYWDVDATTAGSSVVPATTNLEVFYFADKTDGSKELSTVDFYPGTAVGDILYAFDAGPDSVNLYGQWNGVASPDVYKFNSAGMDPMSEDYAQYTNSWTAGGNPSASIVTFDNLEVASADISGASGNKVQALLVDADRDGTFSAADSLLFLDNWGGMLDIGNFNMAVTLVEM